MKHTRVITIVFILLVSAPLAFRLAGLVEPRPIENRAPAELPDLRAESLLDEDVRTRVDEFLIDQMAIREPAIHADAALEYRVFGESPTDEVVIGNDGWLFLTKSLDQPCIDIELGSAIHEAIESAQAVVAVSGRRLVFAVAPDKASIYPDKLQDPSTAECALSNRTAMEDWSRSPEVHDLVTAWSETVDATANDLMFFPHDTHWTSRGSLVFAEQLIDTLLPGSWDEQAVVLESTFEHEGDLTVLMGLPGSLPANEYAVQRDLLRFTALENVRLADELVAVGYTSAGELPLLEGDALFVHDSFGWSLHAQTAPYFERVDFLRAHTVNDIRMRDLVVGAETVVFETAGRSLAERTVFLGLDGQFAAALRSEFPQTEVTWSRSGNEILIEWDTNIESVYLILEASTDDGSNVLLWHNGGDPYSKKSLNANIDALAWPMPPAGSLLIKSDGELHDLALYLVEITGT